MTQVQKQRLKYLQDTGHMLFLSTPAISRQLLCERNELGVRAMPTRPRSNDICTACGSILLAQWTMSSCLATTKVKIARKNLGKKPGARRKVRSQRCSFCYRVTKTAVALNKPCGKEEEPSSTGIESRPEEADISQLAHAKSSSKKRAKVRKDREGLQAMLSRTTQSKPAANLNLMDLMKK